MNTLWQWIVWLFNCFYEGQHPERDYANQPWPKLSEQADRATHDIIDNYFGVVWALAGDQEFFANEFGLPSWSATNPCWLCGCDNNECSWSDFR